MRSKPAALALAALLAASLGAKALSFEAASETDPREDSTDVVDFLTANGFAVQSPPPNSAPAWITGRRGACVIRVADVSPQGWYRVIVRAQAEGETLRYGFAGVLHAEQPAAALEEYRRRLLRYFGLKLPPLHVRAIATNAACPDALIGPEQAKLLAP